MRGLVPTPWVVATGVMILAGIVLLVVTDGGVGGAIGFGLLGLGAIVGTSLAFYAVGRSEDIDRERRSGG
jgi:hypothetical protein